MKAWKPSYSWEHATVTHITHARYGKGGTFKTNDGEVIYAGCDTFPQDAEIGKRYRIFVERFKYLKCSGAKPI